MTTTVFLLSPASCGGRRAELLFGGAGSFPLAERLRAGEAVRLDDAFTWLSGLYFRGKARYAERFASPPAGVPGIQVITTNRGLLPPDTAVTAADLEGFGSVPIDVNDARYAQPLVADARALRDAIRRATGASDLPPGTTAPSTLPARVVLLGSVASGKYVELLTDVFGDALVFPRDFVGRGDMSRGSLLLRAAESGTELDYVPAPGAQRRGRRPPKLEPRRWS